MVFEILAQRMIFPIHLFYYLLFATIAERVKREMFLYVLLVIILSITTVVIINQTTCVNFGQSTLHITVLTLPFYAYLFFLFLLLTYYIIYSGLSLTE